MVFGLRRGAAIVCSLLLSSPALALWYELNSGVTGPLYSVDFPEGTQVGYAVGADIDSLGGEIGLVIKTTDSGATWMPQAPAVAARLNSVYFKNNDSGFAVGAAGAAIQTFDGGATWKPVTVPSNEDLTGVQFPENGKVGYIFERPRNPPSKVLKTIDGGDNWTAINVGGPLDVTRGGGFANDSVGAVVGDDGLVLGTTDGLASTHYQNAQTDADLVAVDFSQAHPSVAYMIGNDSSQGIIRFTDDGGTTPWDSVRCWRTTAFHGVDMTDSGHFAYVCGDSFGQGRTLISAADDEFFLTPGPRGVAALHSVCFPHGMDTGFTAGAGGLILRADWPGPWFAVGEEKGPAVSRTRIRVLSNPSRHCICFNSDAEADVLVYDALGRVVARQTAARGLNSVPLSKAGVYLLKVKADGFTTTQKFVIER